MKIRYILILLFSTVELLQAQQTAPPAIPAMPAGVPVQLRAPDFSQWVIKVTIDAPQSASAPGSTETGPSKSGKPNNELQITMTKTGKTMLRQRIDGQSRTWNAWCIDDVQITVYPDGKNLVVQPRPAYMGGPNPLYEEYGETDFPNFWWVSVKNYSGIKSYNGKPCLYFKDHLKFYRDDSDEDVEAYTDLKTRFPVAVTVSRYSGQEIYSYEFQQPPATVLAPPDNVRTALENRRKAQSATRINLPP